MYGEIFDFFVKWMVICLVGVIIKLMDDYLDQELDKIEGKYTLAMVLDKAVLPYALLIMTMTMAIDPGLSGSLFLASYAVGMGHDLKRTLPLGWTGLTESILFSIFGFLVFGFLEMFSSLMVIIGIQLVDDFLDYYTDAHFSRRNFVIRFGFLESMLGCFICFGLALVLDWQKTVLVSISLPIVLIVLGYGKRLIKDE